ncbi:MAG: hypothetical protein HGA45_22240 [Chloroflexales bacterium]|nr:hypothetical protein [Chloroflexales bacterium]
MMTTPGQTPRQLLLPLRVAREPMERLLVATVQGDPEFEAIEPQLFDDAINGTGMRVLRYRKDGKVDVYWQPGVHVDRSTFVVGAGVGDFAEAAFAPAHFAITDQGVDLHVAFTDAQQRRNELRIAEHAQGKRGFPLLAPVGADIKQPLQLFLVYMPEIDLVRRGGSLVEGQIGDRILRPASFPIPLRGHRTWFIRYVPAPVIGILNPPSHHPLLLELPAAGRIEVAGMSVGVDDAGHVTHLSSGQGHQRVEVAFTPSFPNLLDHPERAAVGRWSLRIAHVPITGGSYRTARADGRIGIELDVTEPWTPSGLPLSMALFTRVARRFRTWPASYRWRGIVELGGTPTMSGTWERKAGRWYR